MYCILIKELHTKGSQETYECLHLVELFGDVECELLRLEHRQPIACGLEGVLGHLVLPDGLQTAEERGRELGNNDGDRDDA